ncbi:MULTISPECIES: XRE family transcriptional regulator [unclassified Streptomyces]|uniref:helix-turn-helix domain-containing protein n=1 Tax=unclassified Streptomyces TaxID=2593676 RepID=UPI00088D0672|nr:MULTISPECIES: XRE family transcriptional regulator [unclassified Streptomyces]PBC84517.1 helix-turn-helix protein [Streptomyces sp. 2321.6]SDR29663.1 Helix-turn-helix domain-containing protein [Streptomyces sp. KS_16]SED34237.1 Helix-turn-helix domain-containing protein [Streptomyces sp. 2133.1]SNC70600.1 Helix-turn-helix domain-containing protein [Streptomyces sp. 2114.4]
MPRWKALPEELDPQIGEFTGQLRRLVDRNGLSVAAVADRTGYSKTSWERYLNGRLLPPLRAVVALAEVTGAQPAHLTTLWELAERAWSRAEMRQDVTMEAISVAQARAALGEFDTEPAQTEPTTKSAKAAKAAEAKAAKAKGAKSPQAAGPLTEPLTVQWPQQPRLDLPSSADFPAEQMAAASGPGHSPAPAAPPAAPANQRARRGRTAVFAAGAVGALLLAGAAVLLLRPAAEPVTKPAAAPAAAPSAKPDLPAGVHCTGEGCVGKDPEKMGCGGTHAVTLSRGLAGRSVIEVRYSAVCHTAWARISRAAQGDQATISAGGHSATAQAERGGDAYTPMVAVSGDPAKVAACQTTMAGAKNCARPVRATPAGSATEAPSR